MKNNTVITYRGAKATVAELKPRVDQLQQQQGSRLVVYRGAQAQTFLHPEHKKTLKTVQYRGATAQVEL